MIEEQGPQLGRLGTDGFWSLAVRIQIVMILVATLLGSWLETSPWTLFDWSKESILLGLLGTVPMLGMMGLLLRLPFAAFREMHDFLVQTLGPTLARNGWFKILILAILVGLGEEMLFRGVLQPWLFTKMIPWNAIILSSVLFGLAHSITTTYVITVFLVSLYLGYSAIALGEGTEHNLVPPILMHSLYDYVGFMMIGRAWRRDFGQTESEPASSEPDSEVEQESDSE